MKKEFKVIADLLPSNTRVLDVGCGDGSLMSLLRKEKKKQYLEVSKNFARYPDSDGTFFKKYFG